ncbi:MAG: hypothetical protein HN981_00395 [Candidatus Pacebacteria bacterium]|jgi:hypothetical protein|nr:hypothetical protein [Candidatus Paceibacterota bacterium]MBT4651943.1 hypothetical protein [Candidatus Paceibacterota bacterium]MBT6755965.1 hypothetical protein [Candidatus Paceibacterota bacterium]MBT6920842.1 hypothetical protein [Candidatus Paceibacterota bacterium]
MSTTRLKTLQPHSGAVMMALYHYLRNPEMTNFGIRQTSPFSKVYSIVLVGTTRDEIIFRTGRDWPCYSRIYARSNNTEFRLNHDHSSVKEEFRIENRKLYNGDFRTEAGMKIAFEGDFVSDKKLEVVENFRLADGKPVFARRYYEVDSAW